MDDRTGAVAALTSYGYAPQDDGSLVRFKAGTPRDKWEPTPDGFLRFTQRDGSWEAVPFKVSVVGEGLSGLDMNRPEHAQFFEWEYPADYVLNIYATTAPES